MPLLSFDPPDRFVAGTVGPPGQRTFFLQAKAGTRLTSVSLEKQQVSLLADRVHDLLDDFAGGDAAEPIAGTEDTAPLDTPIEDEFRVGTMSLGWDADRRVIVLECHDLQAGEEAAQAVDELSTELGEDLSESLPDPVLADPDGEHHYVFRVVLGPAVARAFARRCAALVSAGRPPCPFCGGPLDPSGHICPRANGYKR